MMLHAIPEESIRPHAIPFGAPLSSSTKPTQTRNPIALPSWSAFARTEEIQEDAMGTNEHMT